MKVNNLHNNIAFKGLLNNKTLLKGLEKVSEHGATFAAGVSVLMPLTVRPLAIALTPDVEKENKQYACANSICSGIIKFGIMSAVALPVEMAVKKIDKRPGKFLTPEAVSVLKGNADKLVESKSYKLASQIMKLGTGLLTAIPKSVLTIALIPVIMDKLFDFKNKPANITKENKSKRVSFSGKITDSLAKAVGSAFNNADFQKFVTKYSGQEKNIAKHMSAGTDLLLTSSFAYQTNKSKKIKEDRKKALIYNNLISTFVTLSGGYAVDRLIKNKAGSFIKYFSEVNKGNPKLHKYIEGINIVRPALIFATIYYAVLPMFSTYLAEKIDKFIENKK